jgi:hypothetical protein
MKVRSNTSIQLRLPDEGSQLGQLPLDRNTLLIFLNPFFLLYRLLFNHQIFG